MNPLSDMIHRGAGQETMAAYLDSLTHASRRRLIESLVRRDMAPLFDAVRGAAPMGLSHFVPKGTEPLDEVIHWGKNSLPAFTRFQKRFCLPANASHGEVLWGYNENSDLVANAVGPGYFIARPGEEQDTPVWIDYHLLPPSRPDHWPPILKNSSRLGLFVYHKTIDKMRKVSEHVSIGAAFKHGNKPLGAYFMLCREDRAR